MILTATPPRRRPAPPARPRALPHPRQRRAAAAKRPAAAFPAPPAANRPKAPARAKTARAQAPTSGKGRKKGKAKWWKVLLGTLLALVLIFGVTIALILNAIRPQIGSATLSELINTPKEFADKEFNVLVVGIDRSSEGGGSADGVNDGMTDMILYVHFNNETARSRCCSSRATSLSPTTPAFPATTRSTPSPRPRARTATTI